MTTLQKRLKKLEAEFNPTQEPPRVWQIVIVDSDGSRRDGDKIQWQPRGRA
jgi:hypothetical protein